MPFRFFLAAKTLGSQVCRLVEAAHVKCTAHPRLDAHVLEGTEFKKNGIEYLKVTLHGYGCLAFLDKVLIKSCLDHISFAHKLIVVLQGLLIDLLVDPLAFANEGVLAE